jgi:hypothetical protein
MAANSSDSSRSSSMHANTLDRGLLGFAGSGKQLQRNMEATLAPPPISQEDVTIALIDEPPATTAAGKKRHAHECSVDFSKQHLPDLSGMDVFMLDPEAAVHRQQQPTGPDQPGQQQAGPRWSPFANSDGIASSIAAAGVAMGAGWDPLGAAAAHARQQRKARDKRSGPDSQGRRSVGGLKQQAVQLMQQTQEPQQQQAETMQQGRQQSAFAQAAQQPRQPSPTQQQQQQGGTSVQPSQQGFGRSQHGSSNGSSSTSTSSRQQRPRVQQASLQSSSEPSPVSQNGTIPPCWSVSTSYHQQHTMQRANASSSSNGTSRALSPVGGSFLNNLQTTAVAGAAVGAGQELTPAALAAAAAAEESEETLHNLLNQVSDQQGCRAEADRLCEAHRVAYHWWKELPTEHLPKCETTLSDVGHHDPWLDKVGDRPLLAKPSVRFRKTINTYKVVDNVPFPIAVNAQHYAVLVTDVQPCCPYPEMAE